MIGEIENPESFEWLDDGEDGEDGHPTKKRKVVGKVGAVVNGENGVKKCKMETVKGEEDEVKLVKKEE